MACATFKLHCLFSNTHRVSSSPSSLMELISADAKWAELAERLPRPPNPVFLERLNAYHHDPSSSGQRENLTRSIKSLEKFGIAVDRPPQDTQKYDPTLALSRFIADSLLNYSLHNKSKQCPYSFFIQPSPDSAGIKLSPRSILVLHFISILLCINVFIFSTRAAPICITPQGATHTVSFLHRIDSITTASEFLVLKASSSFTSEPSPVRTSPQPFSSEFDPAVLRTEERIFVHTGKRKGEDLGDEKVQVAYKKTW